MESMYHGVLCTLEKVDSEGCPLDITEGERQGLEKG